MGKRDITDIYGVKEDEKDYYEDSKENKRHGIKKSNYYHRYFEGYAEYLEEVSPGKIKLKRIYVAPYKRQDISDKNRFIRKAVYILVMILSLILFIYAGSRDADVNKVWYGGLLGCVQTVILIFFAFSCMRFIFLNKNMTIYEMKLAEHFKKLALIAGFIFIALFFMAIVCIDIQIGLLHFINASLMLTIFFIEDHTSFIDVDNNNHMPSNATYIM